MVITKTVALDQTQEDTCALAEVFSELSITNCLMAVANRFNSNGYKMTMTEKMHSHYNIQYFVEDHYVSSSAMPRMQAAY